MVQKLDISSTFCINRRLVASSFAEFYRQQHCLYVSTVPSKSWRKDNSALLELCHWRSGVWIVQVPWGRNGTFSATTVSSLVRFFPRSCRFHVQTEFLVTSLKSSLKIQKSCFFPQRKKTVNKLTVSWHQRALWRFKARIIRHPWPIGAHVLSTSSYNSFCT